MRSADRRRRRAAGRHPSVRCSPGHRPEQVVRAVRQVVRVPRRVPRGVRSWSVVPSVRRRRDGAGHRGSSGGAPGPLPRRAAGTRAEHHRVELEAGGQAHRQDDRLALRSAHLQAVAGGQRHAGDARGRRGGRSRGVAARAGAGCLGARPPRRVDRSSSRSAASHP